MSRPYRSAEEGGLIRSEDWNEIQSIIKEEVRTHRHGGGAEEETDPAKLGGLLRSTSLLDDSVTTEKLAEDSVSSRALATGSLLAEHFHADAAIDESKILFDPDEPVGFALSEVTLRVPESVVSGEDFLWVIPAGTPITNQVGDIVFRTTDPVTLTPEDTEAEIAVRCEEPGAHYNVPAGTLTRVGGALDPFLREHVTVAQLDAASGGLDPTEDQAPLTAKAPVAFDISPKAPLTFWVIPQGTRVLQAGSTDLEFVTRQSLSIFPGSGWVEAKADVDGEAGNLPAGHLTQLVDPGLALRVAVDQPVAASGGDGPQAARVRLRFRLLGTISSSPLFIPTGTQIEDGHGNSFSTLDDLTLNAAGTDYVLADPVDPGQDPPDPVLPLTVDPDTRPRLDKIYEPLLTRYVSAKLDSTFTPGAEDPAAIRLAFSFSERAPHAVWRIVAGAQFSVSPQNQAEQDALDNADPLPLFETSEDLTLFARSGWVWARAVNAGSDSFVPARGLQVVESTNPPEIVAALEVYQPHDAVTGTLGFEEALVCFRVVEGTDLTYGPDGWEVPLGTKVSDGTGIVYETLKPLSIGHGAAGKILARSEILGEQGNIPAETLNRVLPETEVRLGNAVEHETVTPYISVYQPADATGGGPMLARASTLLDIAISERAPRTNWLIPRDTRILRQSGDGPAFESIDPLVVLPRTGWIWATPDDADDEGTITESVLDRIFDPTMPLVEVWQPEPAVVESGDARVRVWFRIVAHAEEPDNTWNIPAGTVVTDRTETVRFVTEGDLTLDLGGTGIVIADANSAGASANGIDDLHALANPEDFECLLEVEQPEPAEGGADGGSEGHHHRQVPGALPSHPLADDAVSAEQVAEGAVTWPKLSSQLAGRLKNIRDSLSRVEDALMDASALQSLMKQRHRSADL